jgi:hypothetical protein
MSRVRAEEARTVFQDVPRFHLKDRDAVDAAIGASFPASEPVPMKTMEQSRDAVNIPIQGLK